MTKVTLEVGGLPSVLGAHGIERQLWHVVGVAACRSIRSVGSTTVVRSSEPTG